jgi:hypothetical protein
VIVSAYFDRDVGDWVPFGVFEVHEGRVVHRFVRRRQPARVPQPGPNYFFVKHEAIMIYEAREGRAPR